MRFKAIIAALLSAVLLPVQAHAAQAQGGDVLEMSTEAAGVAIFRVAGSYGGTWPGCATLQRFAIDVKTPAGQALYSMVLSAKLAGCRISVKGDGACSAWADSEGVAWVQINP